MTDEVKEGYYYGMEFERKWVIRGIKELIEYININTTLNIICYFSDKKYFYILYNENLIKGNSNIEKFQKCNHWLYIREKLDIIFDSLIKKFIMEFDDHPRKIYYF